MTGPIGFIGLGNIGLPMALNIAQAGLTVLGHDVADRSRWANPPIEAATSNDDVARRAETILLSLPDAKAVRAVLAELIAAPQRSHGGQKRVVLT